MTLTGENIRRMIELAGGAVADLSTTTSPPAGDPGPRRALTIAVMTPGDVDGAYTTLAALRLSDLADAPAAAIGLMVLDTAPTGPGAWALKALEWEVPGLRYLPAGDVPSRAAQWDRVFSEAHADWVLCLESAVILAPGALAGLLAHLASEPDSADLLQGPRLADGATGFSTHLEPVWHAGAFGARACDPRGLDPAGSPFEIPMQSLSVLACRTSSWVGGNPHFRGDSGAEGYIHEKVRATGRRTLCLPSLRWARRPDVAATDAGYWEQRVRNHLIGWDELGLPVEPLLDHFCDEIGVEAVKIAWARWDSERSNPLRDFDGIFCINLDSRPDRWQRMLQRFERLGVADQVRRVPGIETPLNNHIGCALAHRHALEIARREGLDQVLVFEDDTVFLDGAQWVLRRSLAELGKQSWNLCYLGSFASASFPLADGCVHLHVVQRGVLGLHAIAYHERVYDQLLAQIPSDEAAMAEWAADHPIDLFLAQSIDRGELDRVYRVSPMVASQEILLPEMDEDIRDQFALDA